MDEEDRKIVLFSEWTTMLNLIEPMLAKRGLHYVRLDGSVPQQKRQGLISQFQREAELQALYHDQCRSHGPQSSVGQYGDQRGPSLESQLSSSRGSPASIEWARRGLSRPFSW